MLMLVQLSPKRYIFVWKRYSGVTGATYHGIEHSYGDVAFGPASWDACMDWLAQQAEDKVFEAEDYKQS